MNNTITLDISDFRPEAVIVDAGAFPKAPQPLNILDSTDLTVCCDGAISNLIKSGRKPWRIVGDCDSISPEHRKAFAEIIRRNPDQDTNDQTKAVTYLSAKGIRRIAIVGATGLREDHTLGNISLLIDYHRQGIEARIFTDYGIFIPVEGDACFRCVPGAQVSIFSFGATGLESKGLHWPIHDFTSWWQGTLNEAPTGHFSIHARGYYLLFISYQPK